jgi:hypothetical protein
LFGQFRKIIETGLANVFTFRPLLQEKLAACGLCLLVMGSGTLRALIVAGV